MRDFHFRARLAVAVCLSVFFVAGLSRVEIDASISTMLVADDPAYEAHDAYKSLFGSDEVLSVAIPFRDALSIQSLEIQQRVVRELESISGVVQVTTLVSQNDVVGDGATLDVLPLVPADLEEWAADRVNQIRRLRERVRSHPIWNGWLISENFGAIAIHVRLDDSVDGERNRGETMVQIDSTLETVLGEREYFLAGHPFMKSEITRSISSDLARLLPVSFLVMTFLLLVATRSLYVGAIASASVLLSVVWMVGAMGWLGLGMTALTNTAPTILVALATASFLHLTASFQSVEARSNYTAAVASLALVRRPMWIAALTTSLGYASLSLSSVPIVREFGLTLAVGMLGAAVVGTVFLPAMLSIAPGERSRDAFANGYGLSRILLSISTLVARSPFVIVIGSIAFGAIMSGAAAQIEVDSSGPKRFDDDSRFRRSSRFYRAQLSGDVLESVYLTGERGDFSDPEILRRVQAFQAAAEQLPEVDRAISVADHVARTYWVFRGEQGDPNDLPETAGAVAQLLLLYETSGDLGDIADYVSADFSKIRIVLTADVQSSSVSAQLRRDLNKIAERLLPQHTGAHSVVSTEMLLSQAADLISVEQLRSAGLALVLVLGFVSLSFRSWHVGAIMLLPNVLPLMANLGVMSMLGISLSDATSIISATAIGIAVDSTVHIVNSVWKSERTSGSRRVAVLHAVITTGRPVVVSSLVIILGFSFLLFSEFGSVAELGALTAMTMLFCLIADLFVLPAILLLATRTKSEVDPFIVNRHGQMVVAVESENGAGGIFPLEIGGEFGRSLGDDEIGAVRRVGADGILHDVRVEPTKVNP